VQGNGASSTKVIQNAIPNGGAPPAWSADGNVAPAAAQRNAVAAAAHSAKPGRLRGEKPSRTAAT
jgi:hypothetical protein